ncbi:Hsp20/alpha crystallin family protein [Flavobacterium paronense]|uniref:Hsp20/alpha crystallin family protein n=1 Tax=Flavobacterium paronense TaxID=1392775 RepID=A0ABV5GC97_9FLAO|nr:Hsp20/alpha crystallin family protein [Flavobacterium paronense]MDN3677817.1 Hsp20/alpha crystallin family protein [Flavobacterium paronense]
MTLVATKKRNGRLFPKLMDDFFNNDRFLMDINGTFPDMSFQNVLPEANIVENKKEYQIELAAPGLDKKDFNIEMKNGMLTISAEKEAETKSEDKNYLTREFSYSSLYRSFVLPDNLVADKIDAKYENGVLKLKLPKSEVSIKEPVKHIKVT